MTFALTEIQKRRLRELGASAALLEGSFADARERNRAFKDLEKKWVEEGRERLAELRDHGRRPMLCKLERVLVDALVGQGFVQVVTPLLLSKGLLEKMAIASAHPLSQQVFWVSGHKCLRPMLAPHLYSLMPKLLRLWGKPVRIFEVGSCFRKESKGSQHLDEFTMLNLVELGLPEEERHPRLEELAGVVMRSAGIDQYEMVRKESEVYGETIDVVAGTEVCSGAMGPHALDDAWGVVDAWVGLGFGLERLLMAKEGFSNIHRAGRSLAYLDGVRLNI